MGTQKKETFLFLSHRIIAGGALLDAINKSCSQRDLPCPFKQVYPTSAKDASYSTPQKTLAAYCDAWKTGNAQEMYDQTDDSERKLTSLRDLQKELKLSDGRVSACTVSNVHVNGSTATLTVTSTMKAYGGFPAPPSAFTVTLILENGTWKTDQFGPRSVK